MTDIDSIDFVARLEITRLQAALNTFPNFQNSLDMALSMHESNLNDVINLLDYPKTYYINVAFKNYIYQSFKILHELEKLGTNEKYLWTDKSELVKDIVDKINKNLNDILDCNLCEQNKTTKNLHQLEFLYIEISNVFANESMQPLDPTVEMKFKKFENELVGFKLSV